MSDFEICTKIHTMDIPSEKRVLVTSDIHGHGEYLRKLLKKVSFSEDDILIIVGDILERGADSLGTLQYVMKLSEKGNVFALIGNVDAYTLYLIHNLSQQNYVDFFNHIQNSKKRYGSSFYHELAEVCGKTIFCPEDVLKVKDEIITRFSKEFTFLSNLPTVLETQTIVFVHGGLRQKNIADNQKEEMFSLTKYDNFAVATAHIFEKYVVVGHWPVSLYCENIPSYNPVINTHKHIISIDGGCGVKHDGQLNLFVIPEIDCKTEETSFVSCDELPVVTALEDQACSESTVCINWLTREIAIMEEGSEFSLVHHKHSNKTFWVPTSYIINKAECQDYTDYVLPVKSGDRLSVILKTSKGIIAKRAGTVGWYFGKYR